MPYQKISEKNTSWIVVDGGHVLRFIGSLDREVARLLRAAERVRRSESSVKAQK